MKHIVYFSICLNFFVTIGFAFDIIELQNGVSQSGTLEAATTDKMYLQDYYRIYIPFEVSNITVKISDATFQIKVTPKFHGCYCSSKNYNPNYYICPDLNGDWQIDQYLYLSVGRATRNTNGTNYAITAQVNNCPDGQVQATISSGASVCLPYTELLVSDLNSQQQFSFNGTGVVSWLYVIQVPANTTSIQFTITVPHDEAAYGYRLYGRNAVPTILPDCSSTSFSGYNNTLANLTLTCPNPTAGWFFLLVDNVYTQASPVSGTLIGTVTTCSEPYGGNSCMYPLQSYTIGSGPVTQVVRGYDSSVDEGCALHYLSMYIPPNTEGKWNITCTSNATNYGDLDLLIKWGAYAWWGHRDSYIPCFPNEGFLNLISEDLYNGGWQTLALCNQDTHPIEFTLDASGSWGPDPAVTTTTGSDNSAASSMWHTLVFTGMICGLLIM